MGDSSLFPKLPKVHLRKTGSQSIPYITTTAVTWSGAGSHGFNNDGMWTSGNDYLTIKSSGLYYLAAGISFDVGTGTQATTGYRQMLIQTVAGTTLATRIIKASNVAGYRSKLTVSWIGSLATTDQPRVLVIQTSNVSGTGTALTLEVALCWFYAIRLGNS